MMATRVSRKHQRMEAPEWVFIWRRPRETTLQQTFAALAVFAVFAFFLTSVHIRVTPPTPWATQKASLIHITDDAMGRSLTLRAREGGPFPSRFDPAEWQGAAAIEQAALEVARWSPPAYVPVLRDLAAEIAPPIAFAAKGEPTLPKLDPESLTIPAPVNLRLAPVLYPLSGITAAAMPRELPLYDGTVDAAMTAAPWRFLLRLNSLGTVLDCVSLGGGDEVGLSPLGAWLQHVPFTADPDKPSRWIAVGVGFTNQPANGPDAH
jgi:hypothetical protein